jgi:endonuclease YncB( thermonuclease family)
MKTTLFCCAARFIAIACYGLHFSLAQAVELRGRVVAVADGDTLTLLAADNLQYRITLAGIDAPELPQAFGHKSRTSLAALVLDRQAAAHCREGGQYLRATCVVNVDGKNLGLTQVQAGMAWWYRPYASEQTVQERADYEQAEFKARIRRLGLWNSKNPTPPWDWRRGRLNE